VKFRKHFLFFIMALVVSLIIYRHWVPASYLEELIRIQVEEELAHIDNEILNEPIEVQLLLLDYSKNKVLTLKTWIALSKYPKTREILSVYGSDPEFKQILEKYGESIIPPIQYFRENDIGLVSAINSIKNLVQSAKEFADNLMGSEQSYLNSKTQSQQAEVGADQRGRYAINFINQEGYDFMGQFVLDKENKVRWNQTERFLEGANSMMAGGIKTLETKYDNGNDITTIDIFWAGMDVAGVVGSFKLLRAGNTLARSGLRLSIVHRTGIFASTLVSKFKIFQKLGKYSAGIATAYIIISHPNLLNSVFAETANLIGFNPSIALLAGWSLIFMIALYPFSWLLKISSKIVLFFFSWIEQPWKCNITNIGAIPANKSVL
jgi:hypothetical protein